MRVLLTTGAAFTRFCVMPIIDEEAPKKKPVHEIGEDLSKLSLFELAERIEMLKGEITRIEQAANLKRASADHAATFFKR